jgi:hypothetical protein
MFAGLFFASNLAFGIAIGCGQKSGTAQAVVILVVEVISALVTSIWLPWGYGASMGLISFLFCVGRIVIAVLLVILAPAVNYKTFHFSFQHLTLSTDTNRTWSQWLGGLRHPTDSRPCFLSVGPVVRCQGHRGLCANHWWRQF